MMSESANNHILGPDDCGDVVKECRLIRAQWKTLGVYLGVSIASIDAIDVGNGNSDLFVKLTALIAAWIRREKKNLRPSWRALCKALEDMGNRGLAESIALEHVACNCKHCSDNGGVKPMPSPAQSIDLLSTVKVARPRVSASNIFQQHFAHLAAVIEADPIRFAGEFATVHLVPSTLVGNLNSRLGVSNYEKATELVTSLSTNLRIAADDSKLLLKICEVLKKQDMFVLNNIVGEILEQLGGGVSTASLSTAVTNDTATVHPVSTVTSDIGSVPLAVSKAAIIRSLLTNKKLEKAFDDDMKKIAEELYKADVITQGVKDTPSYDAITTQFLNTLEFLDDDKQLLAEYCGKFLKVLISIGGPTKICGEWIKREIEKIGLEISLQ